MERAALPGRLSWQLGRVLATIDETPHTRSLILDVPGWCGHRAGQHVDVRLTAEDGYQAQRSYSIASSPEERHITLTVERLDDGEVSPYLTEALQPGDQLELRGPIGGYFTWQVADGGPLLLIAGGSGVVPLMAMLRHRAAQRATVPARLLYSARDAESIIYQHELAELADADPTLMIRYALTRCQPDGWAGYRRRIDRAMLAEAAWAPSEQARTFVCGPTTLVESVARALVELGHNPERIRTERFGPGGAA
jgi:ferredoxin-NADP reductase